MHDLDLPTYLVRARPIISTRTPYNEADVTDSGARSRRCSDPHAAADWDTDCTGIIHTGTLARMHRIAVGDQQQVHNIVCLSTPAQSAAAL